MATQSGNRKIALNSGDYIGLNTGNFLVLNFSDWTIGGVAAATASAPGDLVRPGPPPAPSLVTAERSTDYESVTVTWSAVAGATAYEVYRGPDYRSQPALVHTESSLLTWTDTGLSATTSYVYFVRAIDATMSVDGLRSPGQFVPRENDVVNE